MAMAFFSDAELVSLEFGAHVRAFQRLFEFHSLRVGAPQDFLQLGPKLAASEGFRLDFSDLARTVRDRERGRMSAAEMLTIAAVAVGGPGVGEIETELQEAAGTVQVLLAGVGGWREETDAGELPGERRAGVGGSGGETDLAGGLEGGAGPTADEAVERWAAGYRASAAGTIETGFGGSAAGGLEVAGRTGAGLADGPGMEARGGGAPEMQETLARLELANLQLKVYLDDIDRRMGRIEPNLEELTAMLHSTTERLQRDGVDRRAGDGVGVDEADGVAGGRVRREAAMAAAMDLAAEDWGRSGTAGERWGRGSRDEGGAGDLGRDGRVVTGRAVGGSSPELRAADFAGGVGAGSAKGSATASAKGGPEGRPFGWERVRVAETQRPMGAAAAAGRGELVTKSPGTAEARAADGVGRAVLWEGERPARFPAAAPAREIAVEGAVAGLGVATELAAEAGRPERGKAAGAVEVGSRPPVLWVAGVGAGVRGEGRAEVVEKRSEVAEPVVAEVRGLQIAGSRRRRAVVGWWSAAALLVATAAATYVLKPWDGQGRSGLAGGGARSGAAGVSDRTGGLDPGVGSGPGSAGGAAAAGSGQSAGDRAGVLPNGDAGDRDRTVDRKEMTGREAKGQESGRAIPVERPGSSPGQSGAAETVGRSSGVARGVALGGTGVGNGAVAGSGTAPAGAPVSAGAAGPVEAGGPGGVGGATKVAAGEAVPEVSRNRVAGARVAEGPPVVRMESPRPELVTEVAGVDGVARVPVERAAPVSGSGGGAATGGGAAAPAPGGMAAAPGGTAAGGTGAGDLPRATGPRVGTRGPEAAPLTTGGTLLSAPSPIYPQQARQLGIQGTVTIRATVDRDGRVRGMQMVSGPVLLQQSAQDAVRRRRYKPYVMGGQPTEFQTLVTLNFKLGQ